MLSWIVLPMLAESKELEGMDLTDCDCSKIPSTAWQLLQVAAGWTHLKKANLTSCFRTHTGDGAEILLSLLAKCNELEEKVLGGWEIL